MITRRQFLRQIGQATAAGTAFAAGAAQVTKPSSSPCFQCYDYDQCGECCMPKCASTVKINIQTVDLKQLYELLDANKNTIREIIQTGKLNGRKVFYQVDHKMGPSRVPLSPIS